MTPRPVLIVDDAPENLAAMRQILADRYALVFARDGTQALAAAASRAPALILLDIQMPGMDGYQVCRILKSDPATASIPVIFVTSLAEVADEAAGFAAGAVDYIVKPYSPAIARARVATHLQLAALRRELETRNDDLERTVVERTRELTEANRRIRALDRLKGDFLRMISHEIRTPANGLLGMGELIVQSYLPADDPEAQTDAANFRRSGERLNDLIDDATLIADMQDLNAPTKTWMTGAEILDALRNGSPDQGPPGIEIRIESVSGAPEPDAALASLDGEDTRTLHDLLFQHNPLLLHKALGAALALARCFALDPGRLAASARIGKCLTLRIDLDALPLGEAEAATFFELASPVRAQSCAEPLGLSPVVAHDILRAFGGDLRLSKTGERIGHLDILLRTEPTAAPAADPNRPTTGEPPGGTE